MPLPLIALAAASLIGQGIQGNATKKAQQAANSENARLADEKNAFDWNAFLLQKGLNAGGTARPGEIPDDAEAVNTFLPMWASVNGMPAEQAILSALFERSGI